MGGGPPDFPQGSTCLVVLWILPCCSCFRLRGFAPSLAGFPKTILLTFAVTFAVRNPVALAPRFRLLRVRSPLLTESMFLSFPPGTEMFQFPGFPSIRYGLAYGWQRFPLPGFPHSDTSGSMAICASPELFAAYHVLLRLLVPRHPPCALSCLTFTIPIAFGTAAFGACAPRVELLPLSDNPADVFPISYVSL